MRFSAAYSAVHLAMVELGRARAFSAAYSAVHGLSSATGGLTHFSAAYSAVHPRAAQVADQAGFSVPIPQFTGAADATKTGTFSQLPIRQFTR